MLPRMDMSKFTFVCLFVFFFFWLFSKSNFLLGFNMFVFFNFVMTFC